MGATPPLDAPAGAEAPEYGIAISTMDAREEAEDAAPSACAKAGEVETDASRERRSPELWSAR